MPQGIPFTLTNSRTCGRRYGCFDEAPKCCRRGCLVEQLTKAVSQTKMRKHKKFAVFGANSYPSIWGRLDRRWDRPRSVNRPGNQIQSDNFWRGKTARKSSKFVGKLTKLGEKGTKGTWGRVKSFRSMDQNPKSLTKSRDRTKSIWRFLW